MCGICGILPKRKTSQEDISAVRRMNARLTHRGPDSEGYFSDDRVAIGMRRLSIIDLDHGSQPLYNEDKSITLIANGEVYNFVELRRELEGLGHAFATGSDCETIIHAYEQYGESFVDHLRGMFAFCLYDARIGTAILVRDRLGEKPLYLHAAGDSLAFSSELKSLLEAVPAGARKLDRESLYLYFHYGYVPGSRTMFTDIRKLPPGGMIVMDCQTGEMKERVYWSKRADATAKKADSSPSLASDQASTLVRNELDEIERIAIRSDVPVGVSLSGGIDSSIIATLAARYSDRKLHAFSVGYPGEPTNDERSQARALAERLGLIFHGIELTEEQFARDLPKLIESMDEPVSDIAAYGYYAVAREARKERVPVLLAGFGGDEFFWGYEWVRDSARYSDLKSAPLGNIRTFAALLARFWKETLRRPLGMLPYIWRAATSEDVILYELAPQWRIASLTRRNMFGEAFLASVDAASALKAEQRPLARHNGATVTELISDLWLLSNCIDLGDRLSMAHSVELRLPLVDYKLYEDAQSIRSQYPCDYRLGYKHWLIEAARGLIPEEIFRRRKRGFTPPTAFWTIHAVTLHRDLLLDGYLTQNGIINRRYMERALSQPEKNLRFLYTSLTFEMWAKTYLA